MFKSKFYKVLVLTVIVMSACSCNKYLELRPQDGVTRDKFWQTKEQLLSAVIGCYNALITAPAKDRSPAEDFFIWGELRADMVSPGPAMTVDELNIVNTNILASNAVSKWQSIYRVINLCNTVIAYGPGVIKVDNTLTQAQLDANLAEAYALRGLMYFYLVRTFGDVPMKLNPSDSDNDLEQLAKTDRKTVLTQIVADLKIAETGAVASYGNNAYDKGRVTKFTVNAIQADVYLWMDNYTDCIAACDKIINSGKYGLVAGDKGWFNNLYVTGNSAEGIFELQFDIQALNPYFVMFATTRPRYFANPAIIDKFYTVDPLDENNKDIRGIDVAMHVSDQLIYKYIALNPTTLRTTDNSYAHWIMYRYADVLLMKAEACANSGRGQDALDLISTVRTRANALIGSLQGPAAADVAGLTDYIVAERAREFAFEGKRWYDLLRNAKRNNYARLDILLTAATSIVPSEVQQSALNKLKDPNSHYLPIYLTELQNDPNLVQNPFYK
jgi:tetratricopeptide (TPR) repeat protein